MSTSSRTRTLFESATARGRIIRQGDIVCLIVDGGGAMVMTSQDFMLAQKWASSKPATGNALSDRGRFLEQVPALVSRPGSLITTKGNQKYLETLSRAMRQAGYDLNEWLLPPELKAPPPSMVPAYKKPADKPDESPPAE